MWVELVYYARVNMADESVPQSHHKQEEICFNRPGYREGRWEKAVKVNTITLS